MSIPISAISHATRLPANAFETNKNRNYRKQKELFKQMFEIKLNCQYEKIYKYREIDRQSISGSRCHSRRNSSGGLSMHSKYSQMSPDTSLLHQRRSNMSSRRSISGNRKNMKSMQCQSGKTLNIKRIEISSAENELEET